MPAATGNEPKPSFRVVRISGLAGPSTREEGLTHDQAGNWADPLTEGGKNEKVSIN